MSPAAWNVATSGAVLNRIAVWVGPGRERLVEVDDVEGLVAQRPDRAQLRRHVGGDRRDRPVRRRRAGWRPSGVTPASGGGPSHGASTRTSWPMVRMVRASPSTWPCTPPGTLRL